MYKFPKRELSPDDILGGFLIPDNSAEYIFTHNLLHHLSDDNSSLMPCDWINRLVSHIGECLSMHEVLLILGVSDIAGTWKVFTDSIRKPWCEITGILLPSHTYECSRKDKYLKRRPNYFEIRTILRVVRSSDRSTPVLAEILLSQGNKTITTECSRIIELSLP